MDLLDYNSDSDDDAEKQQEKTVDQSIKQSQNQQIAIPLKKDQPPSKQVKTIDISFLPAEIQEALTRGFVDSDEEEETNRVPVAAPSSSSTTQSKLLSRLPPPKHDQSSSLPNLTPSLNTTLKPLSKPFIKDVIPTESNKSVSSRPSITSDRPAVSLPDMSLFLNPNYGSDIQDSNNTTNPVFISNGSQFVSGRDSSTVNASSDIGKSLKRKRERDLEQQLLAGNTAALLEDEDAPIQITEIAGTSYSWDASSYADRQEKEAMIMSKYTNDGSMKSVMQPTKLQNRRHQLSSLALRAAETEIALMDAKGNRMKSKAQTQAKYGW